MQGKGQTGKGDQWDSLIGNLYESVLRPESLVSALASIDKWLGSSFCHLLAWDDKNNHAKINVTTNQVLSADVFEQYAKHYGNVDPRREFSLTYPAGKVFACHDYFDERFVGKSEFYQDFLIPAGARYILLAHITRENGLSTYVVFNHLKGHGLFSEAQRCAAQRLIPHLQRTIRLSFRNERFRGGLIAGETGLNALEQAVFTIDAADRVVFLNAAAQAILKAKRWIKFRSGQLLAVESNEAEKWRSAVIRVRLTRQPESFALYGVQNSQGEPVNTQLVTLLPIPKMDGTASSFDTDLSGLNAEALYSKSESTLLSPGEAELVVLITPQQRKSAMSAASLRALFRLTPAEARLAHALAKGATVDAYAESAAVSIPTVRTQLRSLLSKTNEKRLQDLIRMLATLPVER